MKRTVVYIGENYYWKSMTHMKPLVWKNEFKKELRDLSFTSFSDIAHAVENGDIVRVVPPNKKEKEIAEKYYKKIIDQWKKLRQVAAEGGTNVAAKRIVRK